MAELNNGILGGFRGKVGTVSGYTRYGRDVMRSATSRVIDKPTPLRIAQREKIKVATHFMKAFTGRKIFSTTFPNYGHGGSGYNRAMGVLLNKALKGSYPVYHIDFSEFLISNGPLPGAANAAAQPTPAQTIQFTWTDNSQDGTAKATDKVILVTYIPAKNEIIFSLDAGQRASGNAVLSTTMLAGYVAETWIGFVSEDGRLAANSVYTGQVVL